MARLKISLTLTSSFAEHSIGPAAFIAIVTSCAEAESTKQNLFLIDRKGSDFWRRSALVPHIMKHGLLKQAMQALTSD